MKNKKRCLYLILLIALVIRLISINQSLWLDEGIQAWAGISLSFKDLLFVHMPKDVHPPLSYISTWLSVRLLGESVFALRIVSVLSGVGVVWLSWRLMENLLNKKSSIWLVISSSLLIATGPLLVYYSQEGRMYMMATFLSIWSMNSFWELLKNEKRKTKNYWEYFVATGLMMMSHYMTWFILPVQILLFIILSPLDKFNINMGITYILKKCISFFSPLFLWVILISPLLSLQFNISGGAANSIPIWTQLSKLSVKQIVLIPVKFLIGRLPVDNTAFFGILIGVPLIIWGSIIASSLFIAFKNKLDLKEDTNQQKFIFLSLWLFLPIILAAIVSLKIPIFSYHRFVFLVPVFYLLLIYSLAKIESKVLQKIVVAVFLLINLGSSWIYLTNNQFHREDWENMVNYIHDKNRSEKVLIMSSVDRPFWFYDQDQSELIDYLDAEKVVGQRGVWLVKYGQPIFEPGNETEIMLKSKYGFEEVEEKHFRGDLILKYFVSSGGVQAMK